MARLHRTARAPALSERERTMVAAYLAVNMPLPAEAAGRADPGAERLSPFSTYLLPVSGSPEMGMDYWLVETRKVLAKL
jgi:hypothetical protein